MHTATRLNPRFLAFILLALSLSGCSTFKRDWKDATHQSDATPDITGAWEGSWVSDVNGHHGQLRCVLSRRTNYTYDGHFKARFWKLFSWSYSVPLTIMSTNGQTWHLEGDRDLGWLAGGLYHYSGEVTPTRFDSTYNSKADHGTFKMSRPGSAENKQPPSPAPQK